ncbi:MAG: hypothetical protein B7Z15_12305 [Rhizobiales bacterium 32-66-8]|nr:MAG: hypothetical protein B7Z15_12305 [Rhizobiales bacterium 32-66-8]
MQALGLASAAPFDRAEWFTLLAQEGELPPFVALASDGAHSAALPLMREGAATMKRVSLELGGHAPAAH